MSNPLRNTLYAERPEPSLILWVLALPTQYSSGFRCKDVRVFASNSPEPAFGKTNDCTVWPWCVDFLDQVLYVRIV